MNTLPHSPQIILILGGQRSGKSEMAEEMALERSDTPVYIATCVPADEEMDRRIDRHRRRREGLGWSLIESPVLAPISLPEGSTAMIDSATMLASNAFFASGEDGEAALAAAIADLDTFLDRNPSATTIIVSDEVGLGGVSGNAMTRQFADLQGLFNRHIARRADEVIMTVAGIPVKIKPQ